MTLPQDVNFVLCGSFIDRRNRLIPNLRRLSACQGERIVNGNVFLDQVDFGRPAISTDDFALWIEPAGDNFITYNLDLTQSIWEKGGNVSVKPDFAPAPNGNYAADAVGWFTGSGNTQVLGRNFSLSQGSTHFLRLILQAPSGSRFGRNDVIRFSGAIAGTPTYPLSNLNDFQGQYRFVEIPLLTSGVASVSNPPATNVAITAVTANTLTLTLAGRVANDLVGASIVCKNNLGITYEVISSTATVAGSVLATVAVATLVTDGVTTATVATIGQPPSKVVRMEVYVESSATLLWAGGNLERRSFPTSIIYQGATRTGRAVTEVVFQPRDNVVKDALSFGLFADIKIWRGDGNLFDFGNWKLNITNGALTAIVGAVTIADPTPLPSSCKIYVQTSAENATTSLYVNGILRAKSSTPSFRGATGNPLILNSDGVRAYRVVWTVKNTQSDGQPVIGGVATGEVAFAFNNEIIGQDLIAAQDAVIVLNPVTIPASGQTFVRFPFVPIDLQTISAISTNVLSVTSSLSFAPGRAYVQTSDGATVTEVVVTVTNTTSSPNTITVSSGTGLVVGHTISQPASESLVLPMNYSSETLEMVNGVTSGTLGKSENGAIYGNTTTQAITITPKINVVL